MVLDKMLCMIWERSRPWCWTKCSRRRRYGGVAHARPPPEHVGRKTDPAPGAAPEKLPTFSPCFPKHFVQRHGPRTAAQAVALVLPLERVLCPAAPALLGSCAVQGCCRAANALHPRLRSSRRIRASFADIPPMGATARQWAPRWPSGLTILVFLGEAEASPTRLASLLGILCDDY